MIKFILVLILLPFSAFGLELKIGDIILQPLQCWTCHLIMAQEKSPFSHMGLVVSTRPEVLVAESLGSVKLTSLKEFLGRTKGQHHSVKRFKDASVVQYFRQHEKQFLKFFQDHYEGLPYDPEFLWENVNGNGQEKLYCSEMIAKLLEEFLRIEMPLKKMKYDINREHWIEYFKGNPPDGKWGNAPADFERSLLFYEVGQL